uniref:Uncharacterized protein n=1 Tax=Glossina austeni TaxID=7395 RepID=A0A1A9VN44_GLOAU
MLAIKECLIREGALNLNQTSRNNRSNDNDNNNAATSSSGSIFNALASAANTGENDANSCHTPYNMYDNDNRLPSKPLLDNHNLSIRELKLYKNICYCMEHRPPIGVYVKI